MNIVTINGSARSGNYTGKALAVAQDDLKQMNGVTLTVIEPATMKLAIPGSAMDGSDSRRLQEMVAAAAGVILATPEYHGSFSSLVKLTIENMGFPSALKKKQVALLGVASGRIGAVKSLEHLRSMCSHVGALVLPRPVSVAGVQSVFDKQGHCLDQGVKRQIRELASELVEYVYETQCPEISFEEWARSDPDSH